MSSSATEGAPLPAGAPAGWKSLSLTGTSDRGVKPPPPGASSRLLRNWTASAMISTDWRLLPSLSCHSRHSRRPSSATGRPLDRKRAQFSPCAPQTVTSKKFGLSSHSPVCWFLRRVLLAMRREQTDMPLGSERSSGSRVRFPVRTTRLMLVAATRGSFPSLTKSFGWPSLGVRPARSATASQVGRISWQSRCSRRGRGTAAAGSALDLGRLLGGGRGGRLAQVRRRGRALAQLDDPEAVDAVRDLQRVVELVEQVGRALELEQVVVRVPALADLVRRGAQAPVVARDHRALTVDD